MGQPLRGRARRCGQRRMTVAGHGVPENALGTFGGRFWRGKADAAAQLATVQEEIADFPSGASNFTADPTPVSAPPGMPAAEVLKGEMQSLNELRALVLARETALSRHWRRACHRSSTGLVSAT